MLPNAMPSHSLLILCILFSAAGNLFICIMLKLWLVTWHHCSHLLAAKQSTKTMEDVLLSKTLVPVSFLFYSRNIPSMIHGDW